MDKGEFVSGNTPEIDFCFSVIRRTRSTRKIGSYSVDPWTARAGRVLREYPQNLRDLRIRSRDPHTRENFETRRDTSTRRQMPLSCAPAVWTRTY